ncbi:hypothetical protein ACJ72_03998 [Emergomyces africanus]|uniref:Spt20-like SEP domain-containing protein n=1 Tax=Emergomyces africanus TaxID=1955775 RepID=A0A1B7NY07_9EURO|nr:hypothetical protein ACJ72_03998 [Emergomyces africanus]
MATAVSTKPPAPKIKRPAPSYIQTGINGARSSQPSPSPLGSASSRVSGSKQPGASTPTTAAAVNGANGRQPARPRNPTQKPGDPASRLQRPSTKPPGTDGAAADRTQLKKFPEPYVKTSSYILKKYSKVPPSLTIHLHPTHFRFDQQDGSFPYNSEMKTIIEHIKAGTVPHDMIEELVRGGVRFYENCLIVRVVDHKSVSAQPSPSNATSGEKSSPFSLHNYNQHITPSPFVPYPQQNQSKIKSTPNGSSVDNGLKTDEQPISETNHDAVTSNGVTARSSNSKQPAVQPKVFTTVLHPTPQSLLAELTLLSMTPDPRAINRRQTQTWSASRTGSSVHASTSLSALPSSPIADRAPPAKRQKMMVEPSELLEAEAKLIHATAPPLYLEPVEGLAASATLLKFLEDPLHRNKPPSPKTRRRTVAELAADEALAAEEERFMLIMDERLGPTMSGNGGGAKAPNVDDESGAAPFEPRFSRFKTLEKIRLEHEEKAKLEHEKKLQQDHAKRLQQEAEREKRRATEQRLAEEQSREDSRRQQAAAAAAAQHAQAQAQLLAAQNRRPQSRGNPPMGIPHQPQPQQMVPVSQGQQSSPLVRNSTPHSSSPLAGNLMGPQMNQGIPMAMTSSAQGAGSSPQVTSGVQHGHPAVMAHPMVSTRSQQGPSRHGTPQMAHGTPAMSHATPIMRNATPAQRMTHASPNASTMAQTPVMNHAMMANPQMNGVMMTPQQQQQAIMQQRQLMLQRNLQAQAGGQQLNPQLMAQFQLQNAHAQHIIQHAQPQQQQHPNLFMQQQAQAQAQQHQQAQQQQSQQTQFPNAAAYQAHVMRSQLAQMQMSQQQAPHGQQQGSPQQLPPQQAAPQANGVVGQAQGGLPHRYRLLYSQRMLPQAQNEVRTKLMQQFGHPSGWPDGIRQQYQEQVEKISKQYLFEFMKREGQQRAQLAQNQAQAQAQAQVQAIQHQQHQQQQQQQPGMMGNGMGK